MKKVLVSDSLSSVGIDIFKNTPGIEVDVKTNLNPEELKAVIKDYDALAVRSSTRVTAEVIECAEKLSVVGRAGIGFDNIDVDAASKRGIVVMNTPGGNTVTTGEHAIAMMIALARKIPQAAASMKAGKWEKNKFMGTEFFNKTLGIIGIGRVGSIVADRAQGLKMNVVAYDPFIAPDAAAKMGITLVSLDELFKSSDFISIHTPMTKETKGMVNEAAFAKMKKGAFIVNCARGGVINEKDLYQAIMEGKIGGAALDVFEEEPTKNMELLALDQVIATPHLGASTDEAQTNVAIAIAEQIADFLTKGEIRNAVNFPSLSAEQRNVLQPYLTLAEKLGRFEAQLVSGGIEELTIEYSGEIIEQNVSPVTIALLKGLLTPILNENVNDINAPLIAKERGIKVIEAKSSEVKDYTSMISLVVKTSKETSSAAGAIFGKHEPRIVKIDRFTVEVNPQGHMLVITNYDRPGVVGNIGTMMGENNINIARMHLSLDEDVKEALVILSTDSEVPEAVMEKLRRLPHFISVKSLQM